VLWWGMDWIRYGEVRKGMVGLGGLRLGLVGLRAELTALLTVIQL